MAGRAAYDAADKARVYVVLTTNENNIKRTARETGVPENTIRRWRDEWEKNGPPETEVVQQVVADEIDAAERVANKALDRMEEMIDNKEGTLAQVTTAYGVLRDKIDRAKGLLNPRPEQSSNALDRNEVRELLTGFVMAAQDHASRREAEIIDAEIIEPRALTA